VIINRAYLSRTYLSLGSNLGDRKAYLQQATNALSQLPQTSLINTSSIYETPPWGLKEQPAFLNLCVALDTLLAPKALLNACLKIEKSAGRERDIRWGPRVLDIDILTYGEVQLHEDGLTLPHPEMLNRAFVLMPLNEIAPELKLENKLKQLDTTGIINIGKLNT
jgi:2-amino-4-hydroxy-6-hydroxymethyldihydropteridine diphosphokinase